MSRYQNGGSIPTGETSFEFRAGKLRFKSSSYQWLVVDGNGAVAQYRGSGSVNGVSGYGFRLTVYDTALKGVGSDGIRMKITDSSRGQRFPCGTMADVLLSTGLPAPSLGSAVPTPTVLRPEVLRSPHRSCRGSSQW